MFCFCFVLFVLRHTLPWVIGPPQGRDRCDRARGVSEPHTNPTPHTWHGSHTIACGDFEGGGLEVFDARARAVKTVDVRARDDVPFFEFNAAQQLHMPEPTRKGVRYSAAFYAHSAVDCALSKPDRAWLRKLGFVVPLHQTEQQLLFNGFQEMKVKEAERTERSAARERTARQQHLVRDGALAAVPPPP